MEGGISDEALAAARAMIGVRMRTEQYVRQANLDTMLNFVNGIGDANPLFRDQEYAAYSKYGSVVGHPCAPYMRPLVGPHPLGPARSSRLLCRQRLGVLPRPASGRRRQLRGARAGRAGKAERLLRPPGYPVR